MGENFVDYKGILEKAVNSVPGAFAGSIVGMDGKYLWILSRTPTLCYHTFSDLQNIAKKRGYNIDRLDIIPNTISSCLS